MSGQVVALSEEEKKRRLLELKRLIQAEESLSKFPSDDDSYLERFLLGTDFNVDKAFHRIKTFCELLLEYPEWFTTEAPLTKREFIEQHARIALPHTDKDGRPIYVAKMGNCNPSKIRLLDLVAVDDIWIESILLSFGADKGLCVLLDMAHLKWTAIKWLSPQNLKIGLKKLQSLPFRDYRFHIVNKSIFANSALKLVWPLLPEYLKVMVKFHFDDRRSLHSFIDPDVLPHEYGGVNGHIDYDSIYEKLYERNDEILQSLNLLRSPKYDL